MSHAQIATALPPEPTAGLVFARINPLECAEEIKQLFLAHERPEFPAFFDRTYHDAVADGGTSWIGRDAAGRLCAHIAQFPRPFRLGHRLLQGGLLANLMVAKEHRTLWPALKLVRRMVGDTKASGEVDFLYGDPNEGALAILKAVGFRPAGALRRFVLPLADPRMGVDLALRAYHFFTRFWGTGPSLVATPRPAGELPAGPDIPDCNDAGSLGPLPRPAVYRHRLPGYPGPDDWWYTIHPCGAAAPMAAALVRGPDSRGMSVVCGLRRDSRTPLTAVLVTLAHVLRERGTRRLEISVVDESAAAASVRQAGFVRREETIPLVAMPLTPLGAEAVAAGVEWRVLPVDLDR